MGLFDWISILAGGPGDVSAEKAPPADPVAPAKPPPDLLVVDPPPQPIKVAVDPVKIESLVIVVTPHMMSTGVHILRNHLTGAGLDNYHPHQLGEIVREMFEAMLQAQKES